MNRKKTLFGGSLAAFLLIVFAVVLLHGGKDESVLMKSSLSSSRPATAGEAGEASDQATGSSTPEKPASAIVKSSRNQSPLTAASSSSDSLVPLSFFTAAGTHSFEAIVADTPALREKGLGDRTGLQNGQAMLFTFESDGRHEFWMKDMMFSIDMVWLDSKKNVIYIERSVAPETFPSAFGPDADSRYVIELDAGTADSIGLKAGDKANF